MAAESVLGLPAVWPALLDNLSVSAWRRASTRRGGPKSGYAGNALCNPTASCTTAAADRGTGEAHSR